MLLLLQGQESSPISAVSRNTSRCYIGLATLGRVVRVRVDVFPDTSEIGDLRLSELMKYIVSIGSDHRSRQSEFKDLSRL